MLSTTELQGLDPHPRDGDAALMVRVRDADDSLAFEQLVARYQQRLMTLLQHWCGTRDGAEDMAQDVFLRVFRARKTYQPQARFSTWLFTIAHHVACNAKRTWARRREVAVLDPGAGASSGAIPGLSQLAEAGSGFIPSRQADRREVAEAVRSAVNSLNDRQRMAVLLSKFEHMSYEEIATAMHLSVSAVKSLLSRARETLRERLQPYLSDGEWPETSTSDQVAPRYPDASHEP